VRCSATRRKESQESAGSVETISMGGQAPSIFPLRIKCKFSVNSNPKPQCPAAKRDRKGVWWEKSPSGTHAEFAVGCRLSRLASPTGPGGTDSHVSGQPCMLCSVCVAPIDTEGAVKMHSSLCQAGMEEGQHCATQRMAGSRSLTSAPMVLSSFPSPEFS
jgi:hypothetical protein